MGKIPTAPERGPAGIAPLPPAWLAAGYLPLPILAAGTTLFRVHPGRLGPVYFSPGPDRPPRNRFDSPTGKFGMLYVALSFAGAFVETLLRRPRLRVIDPGEVADRALSVLTASRPLRLVQMHGPGLQALGADNAIGTGPYEPCGAWADALFAHPDQPDGIAYLSRHDPAEICIALFSRPGLRLETVAGPTPLIDMRSEIAALLRRYGKALSSA